MSDLPQGLDRGRHADLQQRVVEPWARRAFLGLLLVLAIAALVGFVGQRAQTSRAAGPAARIELRMPKVIRGGLLWQARVRIAALRTIDHPRLVFSEGWLDGMQVNTVEPGPDSESSRDGKLVMSYNQSIQAGQTMTVYLQFQLDPTSVGRSTDTLVVNDGDVPLVSISRGLRRLP
jgi:hypothetical protein